MKRKWKNIDELIDCHLYLVKDDSTYIARHWLLASDWTIKDFWEVIKQQV
jgi:hypothetical protein